MCVCVCVCVPFCWSWPWAVSKRCVKTAEPIEMSVGVWTRVCTRNHVLNVSLNPPPEKGALWGAFPVPSLQRFQLYSVGGSSDATRCLCMCTPCRRRTKTGCVRRCWRALSATSGRGDAASTATASLNSVRTCCLRSTIPMSASLPSPVPVCNYNSVHIDNNSTDGEIRRIRQHHRRTLARTPYTCPQTPAAPPPKTTVMDICSLVRVKLYRVTV